MPPRIGPSRFTLPIVPLLFALCVLACGTATLPPSAVAPGQVAPDQQPPDVLFAVGDEAAKRGDNVRAEQYLLLAIQRGYDRGVVLPVLLSVCISSMHLRAALDHAESYLLEHPDADDLRYLVATIQIGLKQRDEARGELERLLRRNPGHADSHFLLGILYAEFEAEAAREHLRLYISAAPHGRHIAEAQSRLADLGLPSPEGPATNSVRGSRAPRRVR